MKPHIVYAMIALAAIFVSCQGDEFKQEFPTGATPVSLQVEIDQGSGAEPGDTRAILVDQLPGEDQVNNLYLLFFDKKSDDSGLFRGYHKIEGPVQLNTNLKLDYAGLNTGDISVFAFANVSGYFLNSPTYEANALDNFLGTLTGKTEMQVMTATELFLGNVPSGFDNQLIMPDNLFMSGRASKLESEQLIALKLTRIVARFDIQISDEDYLLTSASVWNNARSTMICNGPCNNTFKPDILAGRFYGIEFPGGTDKHQGGLYAFENYNANPAYGDGKTTCLVLGIQPVTGGDEEFYRININPEEAGQSLKRNFVYQITIRSVIGAGAEDEREAYESLVDPNLIVDINNWGLDEEGQILTDGVNTLAIPSKVVRFDKNGGTREYTLFTDGDPTLTMSPKLPSGFTATLVGDKLTITAAPLGSLAKREGSIDITFGGLKGTIQVIQEPKEENFLKLEKASIYGFPSSRSETFEGTALVSSSKDWEATIYNTGGSSFSFNANERLLIAEGSSGDYLKIYINETNLNKKMMTGFVLVGLKDTPGYSRVIMLKQDGATTIDIDFGTLESLVFEPNGAPTAIMGAATGDGYVFTVNPGKTSSGTPSEWNYAIEGANANNFEVLRETGNNTITVRPKGSDPTSAWQHYNLTDQPLEGTTLLVYMGNDIDAVRHDPLLCKTIGISQKPLVFTTSDVSISVKGEEKDINVQISKGFTWTATITSHSDYSQQARYGKSTHRGYVSSGNTKYELGVVPTGTLKAGFGKIYYPLAGISPTITMQLVCVQNPNIIKTVNVVQDALMPDAVNIANLDGYPEYGMLGTGYISGYTELIQNTSFFGSASTAYCYTPTQINWTDIPPRNFIIPDDVTYVHAASVKTIGNLSYHWLADNYTVLQNWKNSHKDKLIMYVQDSPSTSTITFFNYEPFNGNSGAGPYREITSGKSITRMLCVDAGNLDYSLIKYLIKDGPFGAVANTEALKDLGNIDATHTAIEKSSFVNAGGIAVITEMNNTDNVLLGINPAKNEIYIGEIQLFDNSFNTAFGTAGDTYDLSRFAANFISYVVRAAQYNSHFTDLFVKGSTLEYPFDKMEGVKDPMIGQ